MPDATAHLLAIADQAAQHPADALTEREIEVLAHIAAGASNQEIAEALVISLGTVKSHIHRLMNKLHAQNRTEAVSKARALHILPD
jgi:LuxR family maltose regulon positive regulatory protein